MLFLHNRQGMSENSNCTNLVGADWVQIQNSKFRSDHTELSVQFRSDHTEPSVQFRSDHTDPSMQFRKVNTDPSMQFRWGHTEFLFCKILGKNLDESVRQLSHLQTSPGKSSCQDAFGKSLCNALPYRHPSEMPSIPYINKLAQNFDSFGYIFNMQCLFCIQSPIYYAMQCYAMLCHAMYYAMCNVLYSAI